MTKRHFALLPVLCFSPNPVGAQSLPLISISDPSLQGTTLASDQVDVLPEDLQPLSQRVAIVDQKVVRNGAGTLDFYYRLEAIDDQPITLDSEVAIGPFGYNDTPITSVDFQVLMTAASDGPGAIVPYDGGPITAGAPNALQYALFLFASDAPPPVDDVPQWILTSEGTNFLIVRTGLTDFAPIGFAGIDTINATSLDRNHYYGDGIFVPIPTPEPVSAALFVASVPLLAFRPRRR